VAASCTVESKPWPHGGVASGRSRLTRCSPDAHQEGPMNRKKSPTPTPIKLLPQSTSSNESSHRTCRRTRARTLHYRHTKPLRYGFAHLHSELAAREVVIVKVRGALGGKTSLVKTSTMHTLYRHTKCGLPGTSRNKSPLRDVGLGSTNGGESSFAKLMNCFSSEVELVCLA